MRVGTITFHCSYNYGSALQAYALQKQLMLLGHEPHIIHFFSRDFRAYHLVRLHKNIAITIKEIIHLPKSMKRRSAFRTFWKNYFHLTSKYSESSDMSRLNDEFDAFICGSDQIWNLDCTNGIIPPFFLDFAQKTRIAYAPSLAHNSFSVSYNTEELKRLIDRFHALSVREKESIRFFENYTKNEVTWVVDPVLLLERKHFEEIMHPVNINEDFLFLYELENGNQQLWDYAKELSEKKNLKIVYFSSEDKKVRNGINCYSVSPSQWLWLMKHAYCVLSNSFHATAFSIIFEKPFVTFDTEKSSARMKNLIDVCGLNGRIYSPKLDVDENIDFQSAKQQLQQFVESSRQYLKNALKYAEDSL